MDEFSLLLKPVGGACNMRCGYCFYRDHEGGTMSRETLSRTLESYAALPLARHSAALQGGEPLLAPEYVFDMLEAAELDSMSVQTNATLIDDAFAERFARKRYLVGVSLDGDREHSSARAGAEDEFDRAVEGVRRLEKHGAEYNFLAVVSKRNVRDIVAAYRFLRDNFATRHHQYIECTSSPLAITAEEWGEAMVKLFDEWMEHDAGEVSIRLFESVANSLAYGRPGVCAFSPHCAHHLVVEHDGNVYPCDFYVDEAHLLGNVATHSWEEMAEGAKRTAFSRAKARLPAKCVECRYARLCMGDCQRNRGKDGVSVLCEGYRRFFAHVLGDDCGTDEDAGSPPKNG